MRTIAPHAFSASGGIRRTGATTPVNPAIWRERIFVTRAALAGHLRGWRYEGGKRDLRIDFLRGFAVLAMVADHLGGEPSWLYNITGGNKFLFSAAEGFVFISGLVMGIVYAGMIAKQGVGPALWKALRRAATLYTLTIILTFAFISVSYLLNLPWVAGVQVPDPLTRALERLTLHRAFYLTDVLLMYTLLVAVAPLAMLLIINKRTPLLLGGSWLLWATYQHWPDQVSVPWNIEDNSVFHLAAWQVLFFTGLVAGFHRERIAAWARRIPTLPYLTVLTALCAALIGFQRHSAAIFARFSPDGDPAVLTARFFDKSEVRIGRLIAFAIFFQFFLLLVTVAWKPLVQALGWLLIPLGQSALLAYGTHLFVIALFTHFVPQIPALRNNISAPVNTLVQMAGIGMIYAVVRLTSVAKTVAARAGYRRRDGRPVRPGACPPGRTHRAPGPLRMRMRRAWRGMFGSAPSLLVMLTALLYGCSAVQSNATMTTTAVPTDPPPAFWQTATARVEAIGTQSAPVLRPFQSLESPSPAPTASAPTAGSAASSLTNAAPGVPPAVPSGSQMLNRTFHSAALGRDMPYFIYLPVGYAESGRRYSVLYMLHGYGGSNTEWIGYGLLETADKLMNAGEMPPMLIVLPQGDQAYWVNHADDSQRWGDYAAQDVVQSIDATYRTIPDAPHRAIGGLSMGGQGAMHLALNYPGVFGAVGMHSPTSRDFQSMSDFVGFFGDEAYFDAHDPVHLVQQYPERARALKIWLDVGADDNEWHDVVVSYDGLLTQLNITHQFNTWPGIHDAVYWSGHAADYLRFYGGALAGS